MNTNILKTTCIIVLATWSNLHCFSQGFVNLNFENAVVVPVPQSPGFIYANSALAGWTAYSENAFGTNTLTQIGYDTLSLSGGVLLEDAMNNAGLTPLQGQYSVLLQGTFGGPTPTAFSIGQTGQIPVGALSLSFYLSLNSSLQVTFDGELIPLIQTGATANYDIMSGDISAFAGQTGQLMFTAMPNGGYGLFDNIQFSSLPVPEPSVFALSALGAICLTLGCWRKNCSKGLKV